MSALLFLSCCQTSNNATHLMKKRMNGMSAFEVLRRVPRGGLSERVVLRRCSCNAPEPTQVKHREHRLRAALCMHLRQSLIHEVHAQPLSLLRHKVSGETAWLQEEQARTARTRVSTRFSATLTSTTGRPS